MNWNNIKFGVKWVIAKITQLFYHPKIQHQQKQPQKTQPLQVQQNNQQNNKIQLINKNQPQKTQSLQLINNKQPQFVITSNYNPDYIILLSQMINQQQVETQLAIDIKLHELILLTQDLLKDLIQTEGSSCQSMFNSHQIPTISIQAYLRRIHKYTKFSPQCLIIAIIYIDRYNMAQTQFSLNWHNVHRMLLASLMLAVKFNDDIYFDNHTFQKGGGVSAQQLFKFQMEIFQKINFNAYVDSEQYEGLVQKIYNVYASDEQ